jgi:hypothetical protein
LFAAWVVASAMLTVAVGLTAWNLPLLRQRANIHGLLWAHRGFISLGTMLDRRVPTPTPAEREQIRQAFAHPDQVDLYKIPWNLINRPTPFVGGAPQPGRQVGGVFNRQQLRDEREVVMPKPKGVFRIFITGGSLAYSIAIPDARLSIARLLQDRLNARHAKDSGVTFEAWNAAVPAWASSHERVWIENRLETLDPDLVIMLTGTNDCHWAYEGQDVMNVRAYDDEEYFALINAAMAIDGVEPYSLAPPDYIAGKPLPKELVVARFARNVRLAAEALLPRGVPLLVVMQPFLSPGAKTLTPVERQWAESPGRDHAEKVAYFNQCFDAMQADVSTMMAQHAARPDLVPGNLRLDSLRDVFAGRSDPMFVDLYHVMDKGNALIAEGLERVIMRQGLLPVRPASPTATPAPAGRES